MIGPDWTTEPSYRPQLGAQPTPSLGPKELHNILDKPIADFVQRRLLKPLQPGNYRPPPPQPRKKKAAKRKIILEEFDPQPHQKAVRTVQDYQQEILEVFQEEQRNELVFYRTPWVIGSFLRGWQMDIPEGHPSDVDVRALMQDVEPRIHDKLEGEILAVSGVKFQLALNVQLRRQ